MPCVPDVPFNRPYMTGKERYYGAPAHFQDKHASDGSPDASPAKAKQLADADKHVTVVDLAHNFGHAKAICAPDGDTRRANASAVDPSIL